MLQSPWADTSTPICVAVAAYGRHKPTMPTQLCPPRPQVSSLSLHHPAWPFHPSRARAAAACPVHCVHRRTVAVSQSSSQSVSHALTQSAPLSAGGARTLAQPRRRKTLSSLALSAAAPLRAALIRRAVASSCMQRWRPCCTSIANTRRRAHASQSSRARVLTIRGPSGACSSVSHVARRQAPSMSDAFSV